MLVFHVLAIYQMRCFVRSHTVRYFLFRLRDDKVEWDGTGDARPT